jgi:signal transduction histidine kinase
MSEEKTAARAESRVCERGCEPHERAPGEMNHVVQFYEDDAFLCDTVARFIGAGLAAGESVIIVATDLHRIAFQQRLEANDFDVARAIAGGRLVLLDAAQTLAQFMIDGMPDWERFRHKVGGVIEELLDGRHTPVRAYGEMVDLLWRGGNSRAAIRLEEMWNDFGRGQNLSLLCAYVIANFYREADTLLFQSICDTHTRVIPSDSYCSLADPEARLRQISLLQQRARALETEVERRRQIEERLTRFQAVTAGLASAVTPSDVATVILDVGTAALDAATVGLWLLDESGDTLELVRSRGVSPAVTEAFGRLPLGASASMPLLDVLRTGKPIYFASFDDFAGRYPEVAASPAIKREGKTIACLPLAVNARPFGALSITFPQSHALDEAERRLLVTLATQCAQAMERARLVAEDHRREELREQLIGMVGHDLRTPLSAISSGVALLQRRADLRDADLRTASLIARSAERMSKMISQLLDFTRIRMGGGLRLELADVELAEVCVQVLGECTMVHPDRDLRFDPDMDTRGRWDRERLAQVVANLVGNALQHGDPKAPVELRLLDEDELVRFSVHNRGPAIAAELLPTLFDPFRGRSPRRANAGGLGLGLYISRQMVIAHGGDISVESSDAAGTTFTVVLPRSPRPRRAAEWTSPMKLG